MRDRSFRLPKLHAPAALADQSPSRRPITRLRWHHARRLRRQQQITRTVLKEGNRACAVLAPARFRIDRQGCFRFYKSHAPRILVYELQEFR